MKAYLRLFKLRVAALLVFTALVTAVVSAAGSLSLRRLALLALAGGLACVGSAFLNHYFERDLDGSMERTRGRPLPAGHIRNPGLVFWLGVLGVGAALVLSTRLNLLVTAFIFLGAFTYVVVYTLWLKRRSPSSTVIGGLSGSFAALAGWAAMGGQPSPAPFLVALLLFLWTPPHFWSFALAHKEDYERARVPLLPQPRAGEYILGSIALLVLASLVAYLSGSPFGGAYLGATLALGALFLAVGSRLLADTSRKVAWRGYKVSGIYLLALLSALLVDRVGTMSFD